MKCSRCHLDLPAVRFAKCASKKRGRLSWCRDCAAAYAAKRRTTEARRRCGHEACRRWATWRDPDPRCCWRACDEHKLPGDDRINAELEAKHVSEKSKKDFAA